MLLRWACMGSVPQKNEGTWRFAGNRTSGLRYLKVVNSSLEIQLQTAARKLPILRDFPTQKLERIRILMKHLNYVLSPREVQNQA